MRIMYHLVVGVLFALAGWQLGAWVKDLEFFVAQESWIQTASAGLAGVLGFVAGPLALRSLTLGIISEIRRVPAHSLVSGIIGIIISLILSALVALPLSLLPGDLGRFSPMAVAVVLCILGVTVMVQRERDVLEVLHSYFPGIGGGLSSTTEPMQILVDTSAIIDGRIADISQTGFVHGTLIIPRFILDELRHVADSADPLRRNRGRRGLDMLNKLQKNADVPVQIVDMDVEEVREADAKLIKLARSLRCPILTNDYNLNRVAEIQGVRVLNINELANAVKSVVLPGEELEVRIIQEGKELGQGVGFLDDGTMVVVEEGRRNIGGVVPIIITRVLQTAAGRMLFAQLKAEVGVGERAQARQRSSP